MADLVAEIAFPAFENQEARTNGLESFAALVGRHSRFVFRVAYSVLRSVADADDVVQETFLRLYRTRRWESIADEKAFLARVAWRLAVDRLPKQQAREPAPEPPSHAQSPEEKVIAAEWSAIVHRLIDALPEELRQPLALSSVDEMTSREIAALMGIPEGTVRSRLSRARQILRKKLRAITAGGHG